MDNRETGKLRRIFGSIRSKFLFFFIATISFVLVFAMSLTYNKIYEIMTRTNERNARSEIKQISTNLDALYNDLTRQTDMIMYSDCMKVIGNYDLYTELNLVYSIKDYYALVHKMTMNFPYIQSVYIFLKNNYVLCATNENMQRFMEVNMSEYDMLRDKVISKASRNITFVGGLSIEDFPFLFNPKKSITETKRRIVSAVRNARDYLIVINLYEEQLQLAYAGISDKPSCFIRILDLDGNIISSKNSLELGMPYASHDIIAGNSKGQYTDTSTESQMIWETMQDAGLIITSDVLLQEYFSDLSEISQTLLRVIVPGFVLACILFYLWLGKAFKPFIMLRRSMYRTGQGYYDELLPVTGYDELSILIMNYNEMLDNIRKLKKKNEIVEKEKREGELKALRNQINPHFLFNTLSTIKWMCLIEGNHNAADCITMLCGIISPMFKSNAPVCTLREELDMIDLYISIMNMRLDDRIRYEKQVDESLQDAKILRLIIQPLVENAITHGFEKSEGLGLIKLSVFKQNDAMVICVSDNGSGMSDDDIEQLNQRMRNGKDSSGIGLMNTNRRLRLQYGAGYGVHVKRGDMHGLQVTLTLPLDH